MTVLRRGLPLLSILLALVLAGCSDSPPTADRPASPSASPSAEEPWAVLEGPLERCGLQPPDLAQARFRHRVLRGDVGAIPSVSIGRGPVVAVLLHQTDGNGLCGWLPFARAIEQEGMAALAIDLCRYGEAACRDVAAGTFEDADQVRPVALAVAHARRHLGARRVVVVGASMGGSVALMAAATTPGIDAVVDLSGPVAWPGMELVRRGRAVEVPALVAMATSEGPEEVDGAATIVADLPAGSRLESPETGHGYELLAELDGTPLPLADEVLRWVRGSAPGAGGAR
ncbi:MULTISPECIES: alpha/beta fold hydrolase [unclassified Nocardioides]|uniref:alpha/beta fold hydrolase n=1 Tax=unclassified Nocardioides TaxID=2615069 RepID=UPI003620D384